ncbi:MAG TPA: hypothetical protein VN635_10570 [Conexibacter sp.]|nr:hypothetical protein [Conexibacter sp.]
MSAIHPFDSQELEDRAVRAYYSFSLPDVSDTAMAIERAQDALDDALLGEALQDDETLHQLLTKWLPTLAARQAWLEHYSKATYELEHLISNPQIERSLKMLAAADSKRLANAPESLTDPFEWGRKALLFAVQIHRMDRQVTWLNLRQQKWEKVCEELPRHKDAAQGLLDPEALMLAVQSANLVLGHLEDQQARAEVSHMMKDVWVRLRLVSEYRTCVRELLACTYLHPKAEYLTEALANASRFSRRLEELVGEDPLLRTKELFFVLRNHMFCAKAKLHELSARH